MNSVTKTLFVIAVLASMAAAGQNWKAFPFKSGLAYQNIKAAQACTTAWEPCAGWRFSVLYWQQWVTKTVADSARVKWDFQIAYKDTTLNVAAWDTVTPGAYGSPNDTANAAGTTGVRRGFKSAYYADIPFWVRFRATALAGVGNVLVSHDDGN